jgi:hypothetical protein
MIRRIKKIPARIGQFVRRMTASLRTLPDFLIIGGLKCGTTSLFNYLMQHPQIKSPSCKELFFFDRYYTRGERWYRAQFPTALFRSGAKDVTLTGEASPHYIQHPHVPERVFRLLPDVKLIALLRNPVDRAFSHYKHSVRGKRETLSFERAVAKEEERAEGEFEKAAKYPGYFPGPALHQAYLKKGVYADQLENWLKFFPREQLLVLQSEDLFQQPDETYKRVLAFLEISTDYSAEYRIFNAFDSTEEFSSERRSQLQDYFKPHNERLYRLIGRRFTWDQAPAPSTPEPPDCSR